ncbi:hypothetical protein PROFUN_16176, partial [Planoprotostelium fungivorum]
LASREQAQVFEQYHTDSPSRDDDEYNWSNKLSQLLLRLLQILHRQPRIMAETPRENRCLTSPKLQVLVRKLA